MDVGYRSGISQQNKYDSQNRAVFVDQRREVDEGSLASNIQVELARKETKGKNTMVHRRELCLWKEMENEI